MIALDRARRADAHQRLLVDRRLAQQIPVRLRVGRADRGRPLTRRGEEPELPRRLGDVLAQPARGRRSRARFEVHGTQYCGKGEPNQAIHCGHAAPACVFGGRRGVRRRRVSASPHARSKFVASADKSRHGACTVRSYPRRMERCTCVSASSTSIACPRRPAFFACGTTGPRLCRSYRSAVEPARGAAPCPYRRDGGRPVRHAFQLRGDQHAEDARRRGAARALRALGSAAALQRSLRRRTDEGAFLRAGGTP